MNSFVKKTSLVLLSFMALASCDGKGTGDSSTSSSTDENQNVLDFVAVSPSSKTWDADVTVGKHSYKFRVSLKKDATVAFNATCTGKAKSQQLGPGGGGPGGFGDSNGGDDKASAVPLFLLNRKRLISQNTISVIRALGN